MKARYLTLLAENKFLERVEKLESMLSSCTICPKLCGNDRLKDEIAACYSGRLPTVSSYTAHFGEEPCLSGTRGAGNIFFGNCNLRCVYCQNYQISQTWKERRRNEITHERLAEMMLELQDRGCHNIGFVSPTHFAPQMARAILIAAERGLTLPIASVTPPNDGPPDPGIRRATAQGELPSAQKDHPKHTPGGRVPWISKSCRSVTRSSPVQVWRS